MTISPSPIWYAWLVAAILYGVCIGSFLNVVIYRLPRGQSVSEPTWSYCPNCKHRLGLWDLIPVLSFLMLGRKCRYCKQPISWRYCSVELLTCVLFVLVFLHDGPNFNAVFDAGLVSLLVPAFFIDLEHFIIPDELNVLGFAIGVAHNLYKIWVGNDGQWFHPFKASWAIPGSIGSGITLALIFHLISFIGLLYYTGRKRDSRKLGSAVGKFWRGVGLDYVYLLVRFLGFGLWLPSAKSFLKKCEEQDADIVDAEKMTGEKTRSEIATELENDDEQTGMGQGDAKLALMFGANLLLPLGLVAVFIAVTSGSVIGLIVARGRGNAAIPFGPFLVVGTLISLLWGQDLLAWYSHYAHLSF